ncbi:MAG: glycosyltransferase family 2 protein [Candidatus Wallbacteria bacterium]|nr:glycosyltransferase family 2 protein [Candidatus Wallbacteria bacterium]
MQCTTIIPCYNEAPEVLLDTIQRLERSFSAIEGLQSEIIVVDDGSTRHSYEGRLPATVKLVRHHTNYGYGAALRSGVQRATHPWIGIIDADSTYPAERMAEFLTHVPEFDMVVGARRWQDISLARRFPKMLLTRFASFLAESEIPDLNSGMRIFRKSIYTEYARMFPKGFSFSSTLTMICLTRGFEVKHVPIDYFTRTGTSSIKPIQDTVRFFSIVTMLAIHYRPLRVFVPLSLALLVAATLRGVRDMVVTHHLGGLCLVIFFLGFQAFFFGLLAEVISKKS